MTGSRAIESFAWQTAEVGLFGLILIALLWAAQDVSYSRALGLAVAGASYFLVAAPYPMRRRRLLIATAAFVVPFLILGWIDWKLEYLFFFEHEGAWRNLPRVLFRPENLGVAALLCASAVAGQAVGGKIAKNGSRRTKR